VIDLGGGWEGQGGRKNATLT